MTLKKYTCRIFLLLLLALHALMPMVVRLQATRSVQVELGAVSRPAQTVPFDFSAGSGSGGGNGPG